MIEESINSKGNVHLALFFNLQNNTKLHFKNCQFKVAAGYTLGTGLSDHEKAEEYVFIAVAISNCFK